MDDASSRFALETTRVRNTIMFLGNVFHELSKWASQVGDQMQAISAGAAITSEGEIKKRKRRAKKDPRAPKRPKTAYLFFQGDADRQIRAETSRKLAIADIATLIGERWKSLPQEEKDKYEQKANEDKERYVREMSMWRNGTYGRMGGLGMHGLQGDLASAMSTYAAQMQGGQGLGQDGTAPGLPVMQDVSSHVSAVMGVQTPNVAVDDKSKKRDARHKV